MPRRLATALAFTLVIASALTVNNPRPAAAAPSQTRSYYEGSANSAALYNQGQQAGRSGAEGIVILDFGRPALGNSVYGTMGYGNVLIPFASIEAAVESYVKGYYRTAPSYTMLNVAVGTNNSCGTGQPCGPDAVICGCPDEPPNFTLWGQQFAVAVEQIGAWTSSFKARQGYTDDVRVVAADDIEPAFDPEYLNTYDLLKGYAEGVGGFFPRWSITARQMPTSGPTTSCSRWRTGSLPTSPCPRSTTRQMRPSGPLCSATPKPSAAARERFTAS